MPTLVTGATGFVGGAVARRLVAEGESVRVLVRRSSNHANIEALQVEVAEGDLRDKESVARAIRGCDAVFHVAADYRLWSPRPQELYDSNVTGTRNVMEAALEAKVRRVVYTSSVATLGSPSDGSAADEDTPSGLSDMIGHYKRSKFLAEEVVTTLVAERGLPAVIVNPSTPVGAGDVKPTPTGRMIRDAALGRIPAYVDTGLNIVAVEDVAHGHLLALEKGAIGRRYVLGGDNLPLREILACIAEMVERKPPSIRLPRGLIYPIAYLSQALAALTGGPEPQVTVDGLRMSKKKMYFSSARAERELGYRARPAPEALRAATEWFLKRSR
jgi:dihydroflavonol-4-reductase